MFHGELHLPCRSCLDIWNLLWIVLQSNFIEMQNWCECNLLFLSVVLPRCCISRINRISYLFVRSPMLALSFTIWRLKTWLLTAWFRQQVHNALKTWVKLSFSTSFATNINRPSAFSILRACILMLQRLVLHVCLGYSASFLSNSRHKMLM